MLGVQVYVCELYTGQVSSDRQTERGTKTWGYHTSESRVHVHKQTATLYAVLLGQTAASCDNTQPAVALWEAGRISVYLFDE
jgi:hypothetical protein